jgi:signal transduction histidine kinase
VETHEPLEFRTRIQGDDEATEYAVWLTPIFDGQGRLECVCVWFNDITARLQLRRSMRKRERLTTLGALAGSVAHHYNNLLCSIATSLEFALNMNTMSAMRRVLRRTADAAARATRLTQQLLAFAQADHRMSDLADLTETVLQYFDQHEAELAGRGIALKLDWQRVPFVPVPRAQLVVVIDNLVRNAVEAMPDGGVLNVSLRRRDENAVVLAFMDSGPGILPEHMERLFEPFFTTKGELAAGDTHQAGMGLAVAHGLVSEMHGTISVSNVPAGGARFEIVLPLEDPGK